MDIINKLRLQNKNNWYFFNGFINKKYIEVKGFNTWLQVFKIDGIDHAGCMDISVKEYKSILNNI